MGRVTAAVFCTLACAGGAFAQEQINLADIRKNNFPSIDRQRVQDWTQQRMTQILASAEPMKDGPAFIAEINQHLAAQDATPAFKTGMAEVLGTAFAAVYKPPVEGNPAVAFSTVFLLTLIRSHETPAAVAGYKLAIRDPASSVRLLAAEGLLRGKIAAQDWDTLLPDLQKQASIEPDPATMDRLYRVLAMNGGPALDRVVPVLIAILNSRLTRFEQQGEFPAVADANVIAWLAGKFAQITNNQTKNDVVRGAARLLADAAYHYTHTESGPGQKEQLERVILITEQQLKAMVKPAGGQAQPDVTTAMTDGGTDRNAKVEKAMDAWIGTPQTAGILNGAPYNFERGLGIKRPVPASGPSATAPATAPATRPAR
jgi:hypothetical protein